MSIKSEISGAKSNQWYQGFQNIANTWNTISEITGGKIEGEFNHYFIEFKLKIPTQSGTHLLIKGEKRLKNTSAGIGRNAVYSSTLHLISNHPSKYLEFRLTKNKWYNAVANFFSNRFKSTTKILDFTLGYNNNDIQFVLTRNRIEKIQKLDSIVGSRKQVKLKTFQLSDGLESHLDLINFFVDIAGVSLCKQKN